MKSEPKICPNCGVELVLGHIPFDDKQCREILSCVRCRYREQGKLCEGEVHVEPEFTLTVKWDVHPLSIEQIKVLRTIDPRLANLPVSDVFTRLRSIQQWDIWSLSHRRLVDVKRICDFAKLHYEVS